MKRKNKLKGNKLTPEDVALPFGVKPTDGQWKKYLNRKQGEGELGALVFSKIKTRLFKRFYKAV